MFYTFFNRGLKLEIAHLSLHSSACNTCNFQPWVQVESCPSFSCTARAILCAFSTVGINRSQFRSVLAVFLCNFQPWTQVRNRPFFSCTARAIGHFQPLVSTVLSSLQSVLALFFFLQFSTAGSSRKLPILARVARAVFCAILKVTNC